MKRKAGEGAALRVGGLLNRGSVLLNAELADRRQALETLVELQESNGIITNGTACFQAVLEREAAGGTTAIGGGMAIPHAYSPGIAAPGLAALTLARGLDWGAPDGEPVDLVIMAAVPPQRQSEHLLILARLVTLLSVSGLPDALRAAVTREEFIRLLAQAEAKLFA